MWPHCRRKIHKSRMKAICTKFKSLECYATDMPSRNKRLPVGFWERVGVI